jgi:hypothetical protein
MRLFCRERLAPFKVPAKIEIIDHDTFNARYKRVRRLEQAGEAQGT